MRGLRFVWPGEPWRGVRKGKLKTTRAVVSDRGERWECILDAARDLGRGRTAVSTAIHVGHKCGGRHVWFEGQRPAVLRRDRERAVVRLEDGAVFPSRRAAIAACGRDPAKNRETMAIGFAIRRGKPYAGYHFRDLKPRGPKAEQAA